MHFLAYFQKFLKISDHFQSTAQNSASFCFDWLCFLLLECLKLFVVMSFCRTFFMWPQTFLIKEAKQGLRNNACFRIWKITTDFLILVTKNSDLFFFQTVFRTCLKVH